MEKSVIVSKRFRKNTLEVFEYLVKEFSKKTACNFIEKLEERIELICRNPEIGKPSVLRLDVRSVILQPHIRIFYRTKLNTIELLCLFDMRKKDLPY